MTVRELINARHPFRVDVRASQYLPDNRAVWDGYILYVPVHLIEALQRSEDVRDLIGEIEVVHIPRVEMELPAFVDPFREQRHVPIC